MPPFTSERVLFVTSITNSAGTEPFGGCSKKFKIPVTRFEEIILLCVFMRGQSDSTCVQCVSVPTHNQASYNVRRTLLGQNKVCEYREVSLIWGLLSIYLKAGISNFTN